MRIITTGRTGDNPFRTQQLIQPFFDNRLAITARNPDDRHFKTATIFLSQALKSFQWMRHLQEIGFFVIFHILQQITDNKITDTSLIQVRYIFMPIVPLRLQSEKQGFFSKTQRTAVCQNPIDFRFFKTYTIGIQ